MTSFANLKSRLSREIADSELINKTDSERGEAINDASRVTYFYRDWPELYTNKTIQSVDGIFNIPHDMKIPTVLWFGKNASYGYDNYQFIDQTDFRTQNDKTITITDENGLQVMKMYTTNNRGHDSGNTSTTLTVGLNDVASREKLSQSLVISGNNIEGALVKLSISGSPTGTLTATLYANSNDAPTGSALATGTLNINEITTTEEWFWIKFSSAYTTTENTKYVLELSVDYSTDASNYVLWSYHGTSQITGTRSTYDGNLWSTQTGDHGVVLCSDYFNFQYVKKFNDMSSPSDDNGLTEEYDRAICKMAAGILLENKGNFEKANIKFYGAGGGKNSPNENSAYGILNYLWTIKRINSTRQHKRLMTVFQKQKVYGNFAENWPYNTFTNLW